METINNIFFNNSTFTERNKLEFQKIYEEIENKINKKELKPLLLNYIYINSSLEILNKNLDIEALKLASIAKKDVEDMTIRILTKFKKYDKELLKLDLQNIFCLPLKDIELVLKDLESRNQIRIMERAIETI